MLEGEAAAVRCWGCTYSVVLVKVVSLRRVVWLGGGAAAQGRWWPFEAPPPYQQVHVLQTANPRLQFLRSRFCALFFLLDQPGKCRNYNKASSANCIRINHITEYGFLEKAITIKFSTHLSSSYVLKFSEPNTVQLHKAILWILLINMSQIKGKESENSYQELKRSQNNRHTQTHGNCIEIFRLARLSFSIERE